MDPSDTAAHGQHHAKHPAGEKPSFLSPSPLPLFGSLTSVLRQVYLLVRERLNKL